MPIDPPFDLALVVLLIVFGGFLLFGFAFGELSPDRTHRQHTLSQLPQPAVLAACALIWWLAAARGTEIEAFSRYIFLGVAMGFVGDAILRDLLPVRNPVLWAMAVFGVGHIFYILACRELQILFDLYNTQVIVIAVVIGGVISVGTWMGLVRVPGGDPTLNNGSLAYGLLLGGMAAYAVALAIQFPALLPLAAGAALFMISDIILGNYLFHHSKWHLIGDVIWFTYIIGQALIVFSNATALTLLRGALRS